MKLPSCSVPRRDCIEAGLHPSVVQQQGEFKRYSSDKQINELDSSLARAGWVFTRGRHAKLKTPCGQRFITIPCTPSDNRNFLNIQRDVQSFRGIARQKKCVRG